MGFTSATYHRRAFDLGIFDQHFGGLVDPIVDSFYGESGSRIRCMMEDGGSCTAYYNKSRYGRDETELTEDPKDQVHLQVEAIWRYLRMLLGAAWSSLGSKHKLRQVFELEVWIHAAQQSCHHPLPSLDQLTLWAIIVGETSVYVSFAIFVPTRRVPSARDA